MEHLALRVGEYVVDGLAVAVVDHLSGLFIGQRPGHRYRLARAEGEIETCHRGELRAKVRAAAERLAGDRVTAQTEHVVEMILGHDRALLHPSAAGQSGKTGAEKHPRRGARGRVVGGQGLGAFGCAVADGHRIHQVAEPASQTDSPHRDHWPFLLPYLLALWRSTVGRLRGAQPPRAPIKGGNGEYTQTAGFPKTNGSPADFRDGRQALRSFRAVDEAMRRRTERCRSRGTVALRTGGVTPSPRPALSPLRAKGTFQPRMPIV
jgi:hypothetical protein